MCDRQRLRSVCAYEQSDQRLCKLLEYSISVKLLTEQNFGVSKLEEAAQARLKEGCTGSSKSTLVKSHVATQMRSFLLQEQRGEMDKYDFALLDSQENHILDEKPTKTLCCLG